MIYLIGGSPRSGKSILAKRLARKINCPWISIDDLRFFASPYVKKDKLPFDRMYPNDTDLFFSKFRPQKIIRAEIVESHTLWPGVKSLIKHRIACQQDFIIEGVQLLPKLVDALKKEKFWNDIKIVYLVKINKNNILNGFKQSRIQNDWVIDNAKSEKTLLKATEVFSQYGKYFQKEAEKYGFKVFVLDKSFKTKLNKVASYLIK